MEKVHVRVGVGGRVTTGTAGDKPLAWAVSEANRSGVFSSNPVPSGMFLASWLVLTCVGFRRLCEVLGASSGFSC